MLQEELKKVKRIVNSFLKIFFEEKKRKIGAIHPEVGKMIEEIEDVTLRGGDRLRPFMVFLGQLSVFGCQLSDLSSSVVSQSVLKTDKPKTDKPNSENRKQKTDNRIVKLMASVELLHTFALIHDDAMDKALMRRGGPTIQPEDRAILAGDLCFTFADELLNGLPVAVKQIYDQLREEVIAGQLLDTIFSDTDPPLRQNKDIKEILYKIYEYKTARYSFWRPFEMGVVAVGAEHVQPLQKILIDIGIAFQMRDDYLDLFGDEKKFGKKIGGDLREGKLTIWHEKFVGGDLSVAPHADRPGGLSLREKYFTIFGNKNLTSADVDWVKKTMIDLGIKKDVEEEMHEIARRAIGEIREIGGINKEAKDLLIELAEFVTEREY